MFPTYGFVFIAVLIIASGVIAYLGDVLGRRMGRKRLTLWGLRPRHTAMVMSVIAGVMITVVTLAAAMTVSDKVREGLTQMDKYRSDIQQARGEVDRLDKERGQAIEQRDARKREAEERRAEVQETKALLKTVDQQLHDTRGQLAQAATELGRMRDALDSERRALEGTRKGLAVANERLEKTRNELAVTSDNLTATTAALTAANEDLTAAQSALAEAERAYLDAETAYLKAARERDRAIAERDEAAAQAAAWKFLGTKALAARTKRAVFTANEPIISTVVQSERSLAEIRRDLNDFVDAVDERAREAGAAGTETDPRSVIIIKFEADPETGEPRPAPPDRVLDAVAHEIHAGGGSVLVQAYSVWTGLEGEQTPIDFELYRNRLVFREGEEIADASFESGDDQVNHLLQLVGLLQQQVGARARERGVMPVAARWLPGEAVITSPPTVVGDVSLSEVRRVLSEISAHRGQVGVIVRAAEDTYTAGPLKVSLAVEGGA